MSKHAETSHANKGYQLAIVVFTNFIICKIDICDTLFKRYLRENKGLAHPYFLYEMNHFNIVFQMK